ncbi:protein-pII uridylyltransferase [Luminiphilus syltensis NOR5-1B]|uniref:Bifunctional uridylyltransferase/uridylyl-removing enzyme n=1 Tax=Luminiphilus syltensis NOR5-1B TaxID=565045 RepID=B8KYA3_9GAMM|nr:HD domain-containing protein [Luminiphilus syltensis]EED34859.1 protein-pII uridylyltransferase [Luminiphilus syltensis NOR5-1B]
MQFDLFHTYTVDAHTLEVLAYTRRFYRADFTDKFPVSTRIAQRLRRPALLYIAALYHDIGKGRGGDHSELGAVDARDFCERHSINEHDTELIVWLVKNHLLMSSVAQRKDISDPEEIQRFAEFCGSEERLDYLYTLTVADINGTNPELWNAWRGSLLRQLYTETRRALDRGLSNPLGRNQVIEQTKREAAKLLEYRGFFGDDLEAIWELRGEDYFLRERAEDIAWHTEAIADHENIEAPLVLVRHPLDSPVANTTQIFVHAQDKPELLVRICIELELLHLSIHDARIYTGTDGATLNTFYVLNSDGSPIASDEANLDYIRSSIETGLASNKSRSSTRRTPRQLKSFVMPTETHIRQDLDRGWTILEVATPDRPGLLARLGALFIDHGVALQSAKIQTLGERVEDVFFVTDMQGRALTNNTTLEHLQTAIRETLDGEMKQQ